jgi:hypothetical protein
MVKRTAIVIIHGIGEQVPMETLTRFIDAAWTYDEALVDRGKPDPNTGERPRKVNVSWSKPDARNRSFELQLITTESDKNRRRLDFFEYYWAHRVSGTTWEQVRTWLFALMLRNPITKVPRGVRPAWVVMWIVSALFLYVSLVAGLATVEEPIAPSTEQWAPIRLTLELAARIHAWPKALTAMVWGAIGLALGFVLKIMIDVVGDVVRYVEAKPKNIAIRQSIRENGVQLLETLMGIDEHGKPGPTDYDRIVVVGHSLGTIIAYDILTHTFGRHNTRIDSARLAGFDQPVRVALEEMVRDALTDAAKDFKVDRYRELQDAAREELNALGNPWIVSDFISLGSPLTHAEFLMAKDREALEIAKEKRILPTCPPTLEYDGTTKEHHFTYRSRVVQSEGDPKRIEAPRVPHHAALFAYTRWTNIYSPLRAVLFGDIVSGPLCHAFGVKREGKQPVCGIKDVAVLPGAGLEAEDKRRRLLTHLRYWDREYALAHKDAMPFHIAALRGALDLGRP